ncbi:MAG: right-handed parallel beta-helix repeat-containing protein [Candidatus Heimdallarchaeota archaeon]|nr:right-handed parallel beta-helix repeat-containing protein [Candidatus Heimdallarchaeota archaeon]
MKKKLSTFKKELIAMFFLVLIGVGLPILLTFEKTTYIEINSDQDLMKHSDSGQGTSDDPYVIENRYIVDQGKIAISIKDTTSYLIIRNCYFANNFFYGLHLENVAEGTVQTDNITCFSHSRAGIGIFSSNRVNVTNSILFQNNAGIIISNSNYTNLVDNYISVAFPALDQNTPKYDGIVVDNSTNVAIISNTIEKNARAILLENSNDCLISSNILNKVTHISFSLDSSSNCILFNNSVTRYSFYSFKLADSHYNIIENNTITDTEKAVYLSESNNNIVRFNSLYLNGVGIEDFSSSSNNICFNLFRNNTGYGIDLSGSNYFSIHHNSFFFNNFGSSSQSFDNGQNNLWYDAVLLEGNYWNDYNETGYYQISGNANSTDLYPLADYSSYT